MARTDEVASNFPPVKAAAKRIGAEREGGCGIPTLLLLVFEFVSREINNQPDLDVWTNAEL